MCRRKIQSLLVWLLVIHRLLAKKSLKSTGLKYDALEVFLSLKKKYTDEVNNIKIGLTAVS